MSQGVNKLKELLFEPESRAITDLEHELARVAKTGAEQRGELGKRLDEVFARSGTEARFRASVADTLDGALRDAEVERHGALAGAIAPLVVSTIKTEITNSRDELAEALYPMTGRMVKQYVASAIKDLTNQINSSLERNPMMLRINAALTGRTVGELALANAQALDVEELYLIRRGSGELVARWPEDHSSSNRDQVMSGILTAINEFATEAFSSEGTALRQIDLGDSQVYLRGSPTYLLAAKCTGTANAPVEQTIDDEFLSAIDGHLERMSAAGGQAGDLEDADTVLEGLASRLSSRINEHYEESANASGSASPVKFLLWIVGLTAAALLGWALVNSFLTYRTHTKAAYVLDTTSEMGGYPATIHTADYGAAITVEGLAPSPVVKSTLIDRLRAILPTTPVHDKMGVVDTSFPDHRPELSGLQAKLDGLTTQLGELNTGVTGLKGNVSGLESGLTGVKTGVTGINNRVQTMADRLKVEAITRATTRAAARLGASAPDLSRLIANLDHLQAKDRVESARREIISIIPEINAQRIAAGDTSLTRSQLDGLRPVLIAITERIDRASRAIAPTLMPANSNDGADVVDTSLGTSNANLQEVAETLALKAEHIATLAASASQASAMKAPPVKGLSAREQLEAWTRANAVFFGNGNEFANPRGVRLKIAELARLARNANSLVRIVGYTDEQGAIAGNSTLSLARANKVRELLIARGVPSRQLVAVGRNDAQELSQTVGEDSPNRRVQFELGFIGEPGR